MINIRRTEEKCRDDISLIENYEQAINDKTQMWVCHHRWEISLDGKNELHSAKELIRLGIYYKRPYFELIFLTQSEHRKLHSRTVEARERYKKSHIGKKHNEETKHKIKEYQSNKPKSNCEFGKKYFEHYGYSNSFNKKQYNRELKWYNYHGCCRWEK